MNHPNIVKLVEIFGEPGVGSVIIIELI